MLVEPSSQSGGWNCASEALTEIQACAGGLETFVTDAFDQLDRLANELLAEELAGQHAERKALQGQIDRLASVTSELANSVAEQKQLACQKGCNG